MQLNKKLDAAIVPNTFALTIHNSIKTKPQRNLRSLIKITLGAILLLTTFALPAIACGNH